MLRKDTILYFHTTMNGEADIAPSPELVATDDAPETEQLAVVGKDGVQAVQLQKCGHLFLGQVGGIQGKQLMAGCHAFVEEHHCTTHIVLCACMHHFAYVATLGRHPVAFCDHISNHRGVLNCLSCCNVCRASMHIVCTVCNTF